MSRRVGCISRREGMPLPLSRLSGILGSHYEDYWVLEDACANERSHGALPHRGATQQEARLQD